MTELNAAFWQAVRANDYAPPPAPDLSTLTTALLELLASPDGELRDGVAFETLARWIARGVYTPEELRAIGDGLLPRLTVGIETPGTDAVFERAFAMLILAQLVHTDSTAPFLDTAGLHAWLDAGLDAFARERDLRGYVPDKGWAHATAHTADLLRVAAASPRLGAPELARILDAIAAKLTASTTHVFIHLEDERLAAAAIAVLRRRLLGDDALRAWLARLTAANFHFATEWYTDELGAIARCNVKTFLRSLALQLRWGAEPPADAAALTALVEDALRALDDLFYAPQT